MNATDRIKAEFRKFSYSLMNRVTASPNSIVTAIVKSDAYIVNSDVLYIGIIIDRIISQYANV